MSYRILDDESLHPLGMCQCHAKANRATVVLHVERVARQTQRLGEIVHDRGDVVKGVGELLRVGPVTVSEAGIVRSD